MSLRDVYINEMSGGSDLSQHHYTLMTTIDRACYGIEQQLEMLQLVNIAAQRDPPKINVVVDHVRRVIDALETIKQGLRKAQE